MDSETERPIEKLLRASARKRRDEAGPPLEMHPATRRLLQGEVMRRYARPGPERSHWLPAFAKLWPRASWAVVILLALSVIAGVWHWPHSQTLNQAKFASNERAPSEPAFVPAQSVAPAPASTPLGSDRPPPATSVEADRLTEPPLVASAESRRQPLSEPLGVVANAKPPEQRRAQSTAPPTAVELALKDDMATQSKALGQASASRDAPSPPETVAAAQVTPGLALQSDTTRQSAASPSQAPAQFAYKSALEAATSGVLRQIDAGLLYQRATTAVSIAAAAKDKSGSFDARSDLLNSPSSLDAQSVQRFAQVNTPPPARYRLFDKAAQAQPVLASFDVVQNGTQLRIVDSDGSVYIGWVRPAEAVRALSSADAKGAAPAGARTESARSFQPKPASAEALPPAQSFAFSVVGTNRTLNQQVAFSGTLISAAEPTAAWPFTNAFGGAVNAVAAQPAEAALHKATPPLNQRITGQAVIGRGKTSKKIEINALRVAP